MTALDRKNIYKIYAESFGTENHLSKIRGEAQELVNRALEQAGERP